MKNKLSLSSALGVALFVFSCSDPSLGTGRRDASHDTSDGGVDGGSTTADASSVPDASMAADASSPPDASTGSDMRADEDAGTTSPVTLRVMSLNVYGHMTLPGAAPTYAALIESQDVDVVGIQEGVHDWLIDTEFPTDYGRAEAIEAALGDCYERRYQIFVNTCRGNAFVSHERFDLTDGPNATRTGEAATVTKDGRTFAFIDIHWDHESNATKAANAIETAAAANAVGDLPVVVLGDFNANCSGEYPNDMSSAAALDLIVHGGIDCIFSRDAPGSGTTVDASPSDHDAVVAELTF